MWDGEGQYRYSLSIFRTCDASSLDGMGWTFYMATMVDLWWFCWLRMVLCRLCFTSCGLGRTSAVQSSHIKLSKAQSVAKKRCRDHGIMYWSFFMVETPPLNMYSTRVARQADPPPIYKLLPPDFLSLDKKGKIWPSPLPSFFTGARARGSASPTDGASCFCCDFSPS